MHRVQASGSAAPDRYGGHGRPLLEPFENLLEALVLATPDISLTELRREVEQRVGIRVGLSTLHNALHRLGLRHKKSLSAAEQDRPDFARKRRRWRGWQAFMDPARFVFLDETATTTDMARRYGRSPLGARLVAVVPQGTGRPRPSSPGCARPA